MDNGNKHDDDEVDIFDLAGGGQSAPVSSEEHIETETNVFFVETLRQAAAQHGGGLDTGAFEVSVPAQTSDDAEFDVSPPVPPLSGDADFEPPASKLHAEEGPGGPADAPQKKGGFFSKLFRRGADGGGIEEEKDSDELSLDEGMFIAPPQVSGRPSAAASAAGQPSAETGGEPAIAIVATVPEVTDSCVFEFGPAVNTDNADNDTDNADSAASDEPEVDVVAIEIAETVPEATDSGVFELGPVINAGNADDSISAVSDEPEAEAVIIEVAATVPEVTDSGVFEFGPAVNTDSVDNAAYNAVSAASGEPEAEIAVIEIAETVPEVTDSGVFEIGPSPAPEAPSQPQDAQKGGDEWEIGWEPQDDGAAAEFDVSGGSEAAAETPPPVFNKLAHVCIYVKDLGRSVEFYSKLGFKKRFVFNRNGSVFGVYLEFGDGNFIELFEDMSRSSAAALGRLAHFCLETPDIDAAIESLSARGIEFTPKKLGCDSTYQIWLKDPDGNEFEIHQYTEKSSQLIGGEVEADW